jgi:hypothetical protein
MISCQTVPNNNGNLFILSKRFFKPASCGNLVFFNNNIGHQLDVNIKRIIIRLNKYWGASSYKELAHKLEIGESTPSSWVTAGRIPIKECLATVEKFGCSLDELILGKEPAKITEEAMQMAVKKGIHIAYDLQAIPKLDPTATRVLSRLIVKEYKTDDQSDKSLTNSTG